MAVNDDYLLFIQDQLDSLGDVTVKRMFGGVGFFKEGLMFGMMAKDIFRLKVDASNKSDYEDKGMKPLFNEKKGKGMPYWEVPPEVIEDKDLLKIWANKSFEAALKAKK